MKLKHRLCYLGGFWIVYILTCVGVGFGFLYAFFTL